MASVSILGPVATVGAEIPYFLPSVPAGFPGPAQDHVELRISLDDLFGLHRPQIYLARVGGESLQGIGILDGDLVLIDKAAKAKRGDVVIACVNGEPLLKILGGDQHQVILLSANPKYPPRYVLEAEDFQVWGINVRQAPARATADPRVDESSFYDGCRCPLVCGRVTWVPFVG